MSDARNAVAKAKAIRYGVFSEQAVLPHENPRHLRALCGLLQLQDRRGASGLPADVEASLAAALEAHGGPELRQRFCREIVTRRRSESDLEEV